VDEKLVELQGKIDYTFKNIALLKTALTHSSASNERHLSKLDCNERLEFLGDSILGFVAAEFLYKLRPRMPEGRMTRLRAELVCEGALYKCARELDLGSYLYIGHGEEQTGGRDRPSICSDAMEAVFAAVYLDGGRSAAERVITKIVLSRADEVLSAGTDFKTALQEFVQRKHGETVAYAIISESGPDHERVFLAEVTALGASARGEGRTKKAAEQEAAKERLGQLTVNN
jgi:ribonuclease-3